MPFSPQYVSYAREGTNHHGTFNKEARSIIALLSRIEYDAFKIEVGHASLPFPRRLAMALRSQTVLKFMQRNTSSQLRPLLDEEINIEWIPIET